MSKVILKYTGGKFYPGIPARDLTREDLKRLEHTYRNDLGEAINETTLEQTLVDTGAYQRVEHKKRAETKVWLPDYETKTESEQ